MLAQQIIMEPSYIKQVAKSCDSSLLKSLLDSQQFAKSELTEALFICLSLPASTKCAFSLISAGADIQHTDSAGTTSLMLAAKQQNTPLLSFLIENHCNTRAQDSQKRSVLMYALQGSQDPAHILQLLTRKGANPKVSDSQGKTPLHLAAQKGFEKSIEVLVKAGAQVNAKDLYDDTPLHLAVRNGHLKSCKALLRYKPSLGIRNAYGKKPGEEAYGEIRNLLGNFNQKREYKLKTQNWEDLNQHEKSQKLEDSIRKVKNDLEKEKKKKDKFVQKSTQKYKNLQDRMSELQSNYDRVKQLEHQVSEVTREKETLESKLTTQPFKSSCLLYLCEEHSQLDIPLLQASIDNFLQELESWKLCTVPHYKSLVALLSKVICEHVPSAEVKTFGSYETDLLLPYSDIDLCIFESQRTSRSLLQELFEVLSSTKEVQKIYSVMNTSVPLLKLRCTAGPSKVRVDISVSNSHHLGFESVRVLQSFLNEYSGLKEVYLVLKQLMYFCNFHEAFRGGLSSYCLFLMVVFWIQQEGLGSPAEMLAKVLFYYAWEFDYLRVITLEEETRQNNFTELVVLDPTNLRVNLGRHVDLDRLLVRST